MNKIHLGQERLVKAISHSYSFMGSILLLRLYLGVFYIQTGMVKVFKNNFALDWTPKMVKQVEESMPDVYPWYGVFLDNIVLQYPDIFALLVAWGELLLGISLMLGFLNRLSTSLGAFMCLNFILLSGRHFWLPHFDTTLMLSLIVLSCANAGRIIGIDQWLIKSKNLS